MSETSTGLLRQARDHGDGDAWCRFTDLYSTLVFGWLRRCRLQACDAEDLVQDVLHTAARELSGFEHNGRSGAFRAWLRTILVHRLRHFLRQRRTHSVVNSDSALIDRIADQMECDGSSLSQSWNQEHDKYVIRKLLNEVESATEPTTWRAFYRVAVEGVEPEQVATELNLSVDSVYAAKSRVLKRLRKAGGPYLE